jgi:hypothetical protein
MGQVLLHRKARVGVSIAGKMCLGVMLICVWVGVASVPSPARAADCPNETLRTGPSAALPDCRAYELVTPPDTNGRMTHGIETFTFGQPHDLFPTELVSPLADSVVYMIYNGPLDGPDGGSGVFDVYQAERSAEGWRTNQHLSSPPLVSNWGLPGGVSSDHTYAFSSQAESNILLGPDGSFEPTGIGTLGSEPFVQGRFISEGGEHIIFTSGRELSQSVWCFNHGPACQVLALEPNAPPTGTGAIYDRSADGATKVVSLLAGDVPPAAGEEAFYQGASKDGSVVAFKIGGTLYLRVHNAETLKVTEDAATFAGLSADGSVLYYLSDGTPHSGNIHRFDVSSRENVQVTSSTDAAIVNVSADGSHVYFISPSQLDGAKGISGQPNMYVWSGVEPEFIATVSPGDLDVAPALDNWTSRVVNAGGEGPGANSSRSTPDGTKLVFESEAQLTGYNNDGHTEIYRYDDEAKGLLCVSCNPRSGLASGDARLQELDLVRGRIVVNNLSSDGSRVFFETSEALIERDTDGINDIYQWTGGGGGGTVDLISSGQSEEYPIPEGWESPFVPRPNLLLGVSPDAENVVFLSQDALVPGAAEGGAVAIYDARVEGGFPQPVPPAICVEEGCRPLVDPAPSLHTPSSEVTVGSGNVKPRKHRCRRDRRGAKQRKHKRCPRRHSKKRHSRGRASQSYVAGLSGSATAGAASTPPAAASAPSAAPNPIEAGGSASPLAAEIEFGFESAEAEISTTSAGMHPDFTTDFTLEHHVSGGLPDTDAYPRDITVSLPPGLLGNPNAIPSCDTGRFVAFGNCSTDAQVGVTEVQLGKPLYTKFVEPVYNLTPPHPKEEIARLGFIAGLFPVFIDIGIRTASDYGVTATIHRAPGMAAVIEAKTTLWGDPADPSHDELRLTTLEAARCTSGTACEAPEGKRPSKLDPTVFMTNPSACQSQAVGFAITSYQLPGQTITASPPLASIDDCQGLPFDPNFEAQPTTSVAGAPTGLKTTLNLPRVEEVGSKSTSTMREARVTLPEGMTIAAGAANGIAACSDRQVGFHEEVDAACPDASKIGTVEITSPSLPEPLNGWLYQRAPRPGHLFGLWVVSDEFGLHVKLPAEIEPNPETGQLTTVFRELPQVPVDGFSLNVWGGPRAPLKNPESCGSFSTGYTFTPHSQDPPVSGKSQMTIDQGCGPRAFSPKLSAGVTKPLAGAFSPFAFDLVREDGEQNIRGIELSLPEGELAKIAGVTLCPDALAASGSCPGESKIGSVIVAAGPGPAPLWLPQPGKPPAAVYLAGPYKGAPFSVVTSVPAQAGPFNLGLVTVRSALHIDPVTAQATVKSDPLPQFIEGVAANYRRIHVTIDRQGFSLNPTDCRELAVTSSIASTQGTVATPSARFQVDGCRALKFKPKLALKLRGGIRRGDYPALTAIVKARKGDANIGRVSVALPHSAFLAQEHIVTICTRKRFAADNCPKGSIYGRAKAVTPLLDKALEGPVYLRSSDNPLPDLVVALDGELDVELSGRIDSHKQGIRTTFDAVPDAPISRFVLKMKGGAKGLLVNSVSACGTHRATVRMRAQNGRALGGRPPLVASGCKKKLRQASK